MRKFTIASFTLLLSFIDFNQGFAKQHWINNKIDLTNDIHLEVNSVPRETQIRRSLLVTGCGRSGTGFISAFFKANKLDVGHEYLGAFGISAWTMAVDADTTPWGPGANQCTFDHIFHQVRHPLKTIASAGNEPPASWIFVKQFVPEIEMDDPKIVKGAKYWYYWNLLAEKKAEWTYRVEDIENQLGEMIARLGVDLDPSVLQNIPTNTNTRWYPDVYTWDDLKQSVSEELYYNILAMAIRYGYELDDL